MPQAADKLRSYDQLIELLVDQMVRELLECTEVERPSPPPEVDATGLSTSLPIE